MTASARQVLPSGPVEHLVFSDGLASVSVFVEIGRVEGANLVREEDAATLGTSSAYSIVVQGYRVTAVGEVPPETVRVIARAIHNAAPDGGATDPVSNSVAATADAGRDQAVAAWTNSVPATANPAPPTPASPGAAGMVHGFGPEPLFSPPARH